MMNLKTITITSKCGRVHEEINMDLRLDLLDDLYNSFYKLVNQNHKQLNKILRLISNLSEDIEGSINYDCFETEEEIQAFAVFCDLFFLWKFANNSNLFIMHTLLDRDFIIGAGDETLN
jgi:hypothetical protein